MLTWSSLLKEERVVFLALYVALKHLNKSYAAIGAIVAIASEIIALAYNSSPLSLNGGLVYLSDQYVAATTATQHIAFATAAEGLIAVTNAVAVAGYLDRDRHAGHLSRHA
jgi:hypothetical protein